MCWFAFAYSLASGSHKQPRTYMLESDHNKLMRYYLVILWLRRGLNLTAHFTFKTLLHACNAFENIGHVFLFFHVGEQFCQGRSCVVLYDFIMPGRMCSYRTLA